MEEAAATAPRRKTAAFRRRQCSGGNPRSGYPGSDDDGSFRVVRPPGGIVLEQLLMGTGWRRWRVMASNTSTTASLGGAVQRSLGDGGVLMVARRLDMLSVVVVASTTCLARFILWFLS